MPIIWQSAFLSRYADDAETDAAASLDYLFYRFTLSTTQGTSTYTLPTFVKSVVRITWKGYKVWPLSWREMADLNPASMVATGGNLYESPEGRPRFYCFHPNDLRNIRFFPTPNQTIAADDTKVNDTNDLQDVVCISCWRSPDTTIGEQLPSYVARRTKKAFVLKYAWAKEGKGQNLVASNYYDAKYKFQLELLKKVNEHCFLSRRHRLDDSYNLAGFGRRKPRPVLPPNFARGSY